MAVECRQLTLSGLRNGVIAFHSVLERSRYWVTRADRLLCITDQGQVIGFVVSKANAPVELLIHEMGQEMAWSKDNMIRDRLPDWSAVDFAPLTYRGRVRWYLVSPALQGLFDIPVSGGFER